MIRNSRQSTKTSAGKCGMNTVVTLIVSFRSLSYWIASKLVLQFFVQNYVAQNFDHKQFA